MLGVRRERVYREGWHHRNPLSTPTVYYFGHTPKRFSSASNGRQGKALPYPWRCSPVASAWRLRCSPGAAARYHVALSSLCAEAGGGEVNAWTCCLSPLISEPFGEIDPQRLCAPFSTLPRAALGGPSRAPGECARGAPLVCILRVCCGSSDRSLRGAGVYPTPTPCKRTAPLSAPHSSSDSSSVG